MKDAGLHNGKRKKIAWVTPDYFADCDLNFDTLAQIVKIFDVHWIVLLPTRNARFSEKDFDGLLGLQGLTIEFMYSSLRQRNPGRLFYYLDLFRKIKKLHADLIYLNCVPDPYFMPFFWLLNKRKTVFTAHYAEVGSGFGYEIITRTVFNLSYKFVKNICIFSPSQAKIFKKKFTKARVFVILLALKSFGKSNLFKSDKTVKFLSFGVINYSKNIELLIAAACNIYEKGYRNFKVSINGFCDNWDYYQSYIRYPELFDCNIRIIKNSEIADLFTSAHYFVQPYRLLSQSGAMKVAFNYNLPVIASNLPGFSDEIENGINGFLFDPDKVDDLEQLMMRILDSHQKQYPALLDTMRDYTRDNYSSTALGNKYIKMFNEVINTGVD